MSIGGVIEALQQGLSGAAGRFLAFGADGDFASTLTLGQIIKGKVMRHYEGGRYGVSFNGQEKVVDSTFPMSSGEVIYARVIGVDEKVHLQRVVADHQKPDSGETSDDRALSPYGGSHRRDTIRQLFDRYQARLSAEEHRLIEQLQGALGGSRNVAVSALILSKLGVGLDSGLIRAVHRVLADICSDTRMEAHLPAAYSVSDAAGMPYEKMVEGLAAVLCSVAGKGLTNPTADAALHTPGEMDIRQPELQTFFPDSRFGQGSDKEHLEWLLGQWLLNAQTGGAVAHRLMRIPLWFDGQLIEVTLALFAQRETAAEKQEGEPELRRYRSVVFSLDTESLGHLEIQVKLADHRAQLEVTADRTATAEYLGGHMASLRSALAAYGWQADDIRYGVKTDPGGPVQAVVEHFIAQDSLNRLI